MIVTAAQNNTQFQALQEKLELQASGGFLDALAFANQSYSQIAAATPQNQSPITEKSSATATKTEHQELETYLNDYVRKGPVQQLREKILKKMGLTEEKLKDLPPQQRAAIEDEIARKIKEYLLAHQTTQQHAGEPALAIKPQPLAF